MKKLIIVLILLFSMYEFSFSQANLQSVFLEELTWTEVEDFISRGNSSIIIPTGGTEQNGPHMVLGKHNFIMKYTAEKIARELGNTLVAPVIAYVPEGEIQPAEGHMMFPGTITLPDEYFIKLLEFTIRSFKLHGFMNIILIGDSGGNQDGMKIVSEYLNEEWKNDKGRVLYIPDYYDIEKTEYREWLKVQGESDEAIGSHAGISSTSQLLSIYPEYIRMDKLNIANENKEMSDDEKFNTFGISGDPLRSTKAYGEKGLQLKIDAAVKQIISLKGN